MSEKKTIVEQGPTFWFVIFFQTMKGTLEKYEIYEDVKIWFWKQWILKKNLGSKHVPLSTFAIFEIQHQKSYMAARYSN